MNKIPVWRTVGQTYGFAFGKYFTILAIIWLPMLVQSAITFSLQTPLHDLMAAAARGQPPMLDPRFARLNMLVQIVALIALTIVSVGITKEVLGLRTGPRFFYLRFGAAELRVVVGYFALLLLFIVFVFAFVIGVLILAGIAGAIAAQLASPAAKGIAALVIVGAAFAVWLTLLYAIVRLTFLFLPSTVAEHRIGIARSWELTRGNFWRIFLIGILVLLPLIVASFVLGLTILGSGYFDFAMHHARDPQAIQQFVMQRMELFFQAMPIILVVNFFIAPVIYGLTIAPASFAYRALMPAPVEVAPIVAPSPAEEPAQKAEDDSGLPKEIAEVLDPPNGTRRKRQDLGAGTFLAAALIFAAALARRCWLATEHPVFQPSTS